MANKTNFDEFLEGFEDAFLEEKPTYEFIDRLTGLVKGYWDFRTTHFETHLFALNVKGYTTGDSMEDEQYFEDFRTCFQEDFGIELLCGGRSGGWWGFDVDDMFDTGIITFKKDIKNNPDFVAAVNNVATLFDEEEPDYFEAGRDFYNECESEKLADYFTLTDDFIKHCDEMHKVIVDNGSNPVYENYEESIKPAKKALFDKFIEECCETEEAHCDVAPNTEEADLAVTDSCCEADD